MWVASAHASRDGLRYLRCIENVVNRRAKRRRNRMTDAETETGAHHSFAEMTKEQIAIYAKELNESFRKERGLRTTLQERDSMLDQRAREVTALNHLLQQQLTEWHGFAEDYREVLLSIRDLLTEGDFGPERTEALSRVIDDAATDLKATG